MLGSGIQDRAGQAWLLAVVAAFSGMLAYKAMVGGITVDEPAHLVSSYCYWQTGRTMPPRDMPPLIRIVGGWTTQFSKPPLSRQECEEAQGGNEWDLAAAMMTRLDAAGAKRIFGAARLPLTLFPVLTMLLAWWWARQVAGAGAAAFTILLLALGPTFRGHGAVFKNDEAASFCFLLFFYVLWRYWREPGWREVLVLAGVSALAVSAKYSLVIVAPLALGALAVRGEGPRWKRLVLYLAVFHAALCVLFLPETGWISGEQRRAFRAMAGLPGWFATATAVGKVVPVPLAMVDGLASLLVSNRFAAPVYFLGEYHRAGHPAYFAVVLAAKLPIPILALLGCGLARAALELARRRRVPATMYWLAPAALYVAAASMTNLQLGVRLILPAIPFLMLVAGENLDWLWKRRTFRAAAAAAVLWLGVQTVRTYPNGMSFLNAAIDGSPAAIELFSDSNLDWGQSLQDLAAYAREKRIGHLHLGYFGFDNPHYYFREEAITKIPMPWNKLLANGRTVYEPGSGTYAISATALTGQYFPPELRGYFSRFRARRPDAVVANSIFIYIY